MNKHYFYYSYVYNGGFGCGICCSETPVFPLCYTVINTRKEIDGSATISFWQEISQDEFEEMSKIINVHNERNTIQKDWQRMLEAD